jgi:DNA-binding LytR/AlgR family response regulator
MKSIIIDDEPLSREAIELLIKHNILLDNIGSFNNCFSASQFLISNKTDLIFLDIEMPGINGLEFAKQRTANSLIIFTTAHTEYALESYEVDAIDYLLKPIQLSRFQKAIAKAVEYNNLILNNATSKIESFSKDFIYVKAERKYFKVLLRDLLYIEGLKDYVILHTKERKIITAMNIKVIHEQLPQHHLVRVSKSFLVNVTHIDAVDNNSIYINDYEIAIGKNYRDHFFNAFINNNIVKR